MEAEVRPIRGREELEQCFDLWGTVFGEGRRFFQSRLDGDRAYDPSTTWVAVAAGDIVSAAQIFPFDARWGSGTVAVAGIGSVATRASHRGQGLALAVLNAQRAWLADQGVPLALLFARERAIPLYERAGYVRLPFGTTVAWSPDGAAARGGYRVRAAQPGDWPDIRAIYAAQLDHWPLGHVRSDAFWTDAVRWAQQAQPEGVWLVAEQAGRLAGYFFGEIPEGGRAEGESPGEAPIRLWEVVAHPEHPGAAEALVDDAHQRMGAPGDVRLSLPAGHILARGRAVAPGRHRGMWSLVNAAALMRAIGPVLMRRAEDAGMPALTLRTGPSDVRLAWAGGVRTLQGADLLQAVVMGIDGDQGLGALFPAATPFLWSLDQF